MNTVGRWLDLPQGLCKSLVAGDSIALNNIFNCYNVYVWSSSEVILYAVVLANSELTSFTH